MKYAIIAQDGLLLVPQSGDGEMLGKDREGVDQYLEGVVKGQFALHGGSILLAEEARTLCYGFLVNFSSRTYHACGVVLCTEQTYLLGLHLSQLVKACLRLWPFIELVVEKRRKCFHKPLVYRLLLTDLRFSNSMVRKRSL